MNRSELLRVILLASSLNAASAFAQTQTLATPTPATNYVQTSKLVGMKVTDSNGETVGTIKDIVLARETGGIAYTVISTGDAGTRLTGTTKTVAVPWKIYGASSDANAMTLTVNRERVYAAPAFEYSRINEYSTSGYIDKVYSYYGLRSNGASSAESVASPNLTVQPTLPASTESAAPPVATATPSVTTRVPRTRTATPTPTATASPPPSATPTLTTTPTATPTLTPTPTPIETPTPSATPTPIPTTTTTPTPSATATATSSLTPMAEISPSATSKPRSSWAAAASRTTATPSPSATLSASGTERKSSPKTPGEGPSSPAKKIGRYRPTPTPSPTPKKTTW